jgi:hypothetical protein
VDARLVKALPPRGVEVETTVAAAGLPLTPARFEILSTPAPDVSAMHGIDLPLAITA